MKQPATVAVWLRLTTVIAALLVLMVGVTFALFRSNMTELQGNTISSASAHLLLSADGQNFSDTLPGFSFSDVQPGGAPLPLDGDTVYFKNDGTTNLNVGVNMNSAINNPDNLNLAGVSLVIDSSTQDGVERKYQLSTLYNRYNDGAYEPTYVQLAPGQTAQLKLRVQISADAITSTTSQAELQNVDFMFRGDVPS